MLITKFFLFLQSRIERWRSAGVGRDLVKMDFEVTKKNFKKVLVDWKKIFTFALANQEQDDRIKIPGEARRTKFIDIRYNNQVRKKNQSVNFRIEFEYKDKQTYNGEFDPGSG